MNNKLWLTKSISAHSRLLSSFVAQSYKREHYPVGSMVIKRFNISDNFHIKLITKRIKWVWIHQGISKKYLNN